MNNTAILYAVVAFCVCYVIQDKLRVWWKATRAAELSRREAEAAKAQAVIDARKAEETEWKTRWAGLTDSMAKLSDSIESSTVTSRAISETSDSSFIMLADNLTALGKSLDATHVDGADATKLLAGTLKACEAIAEATVQFRNEVAEFRTLITGPKPETAYPEDNVLKPSTESQANIIAKTFEAVLRGIPVQQAADEAQAEEEKKTMFSATSLGMEE